MQSDIISNIDRYKYVSFDIFDTLITRNLSDPYLLFTIVQKKYEKLFKTKICNFKKIRLQAERNAHKKTNAEDVSLDLIYENFDNKNNLDLQKLKELEIKTEVDLCERNNIGYEIYKYCIKQKKVIIITSDMYLPMEVIEKILSKNNIKYFKLFLSSEIGLTKHTGHLFDYIIKDLKINKNEIIHIGDNPINDYHNPLSKGINAILLKKNQNIIHENKKDVKKTDQFAYSCLIKFINNNITSIDDYFYRTGYEIFGPVLYGFSKWLDENFNTNKYDQIYFLSRDGYVMKKAYDIVNQNNNSKYVYTSRRALIVPTIWMYKDLKEISNNMFIPKIEKISSFLERLGLNAQNYSELINIDETITLNQIQNNHVEFYNVIKNELYENSKVEYNNLLNYFNYISFSGNVAIVDIGWQGNLQNALESINNKSNINAKIDGYYVGIDPNSKKQFKYNMNGYLYKKNKNEKLRKLNFFALSIFEIMFLAHHGSVKKYTSSAEKIEFYSYEYENTISNEYLKRFQEGALKFVKDFNDSNLSKYINYNEYIAMYNFLEFGNRPNQNDINHFGEIEYYDIFLRKLVNAKSFSYYIFHIKTFFKDFKNSFWKTAFLKKVLKINFPYSILNFLRKK